MSEEHCIIARKYSAASTTTADASAPSPILGFSRPTTGHTPVARVAPRRHVGIRRLTCWIAHLLALGLFATKGTGFLLFLLPYICVAVAVKGLTYPELIQQCFCLPVVGRTIATCLLCLRSPYAFLLQPNVQFLHRCPNHLASEVSATLPDRLILYGLDTT